MTVDVVIADDSPIFRAFLTRVIDGDPGLKVVSEAENGKKAVEAVLARRPDLVVLDVQMPVMSGLEAIEQIMAHSPTPILVMTGDSRGRTGQLAMEAVRRGALDLMMKPEAPTPEDERKLCAHIRSLADVPVVRHVRGSAGRVETPEGVCGRAPSAVGIVASTGGPSAVAGVLQSLREGFPAAILIVQHISHGFVPTLAEWLRKVANFPVVIAEHGMSISGGRALLAPDGLHMRVAQGGRVLLSEEGPTEGHCPSGDVLLESIAQSFGTAGAGVVLTGMGRDGARGLLKVRQVGGLTLAQSKETCVVFGMPKAALELRAAEFVVSPAGIGEYLLRAAGDFR